MTRSVSYSSTLILELFQEIVMQGGSVEVTGNAVSGPGKSVEAVITVPGSPGVMSNFRGGSPGPEEGPDAPPVAAEAISRALQVYERVRAIGLCLADETISAWVHAEHGHKTDEADAIGRRARVRREVDAVLAEKPHFRPEQVRDVVRIGVESFPDRVGGVSR